MKTVSKKLILGLMVMIFAVMPVQAATTAPAKVVTAAKNCINENNKCIVIDQGAGKMYVMFKKSGKWTLVKSFRCVCGDYINPKCHYFLLRNKDTDKKSWRDGKLRWKYGMYVDCYEDAPMREMRIKSYVQKYSCKTKKWTTKKDGVNNNFGWAVCESNAKWLYENCKNGTAVMSVN